MKNFILPILLLSVFMVYSQEYYPGMMDDPSYNFYDVVKAGEAYYETHPTGKGSGYKGFQRWIAENESKYYPSGDRSQVDPYFVQHAFEEFVAKNPATHRLFPNGWRDLGPYAANNITRGYNPGIGRVEAFWVNPNNNQQIYMGSRSGGFWKTSNEGLSWRNTTDFLIASGVNTIAVSPTNPDSILINIRNGGNGTSHGIYRSTDGGDTWNLTPFNPTNLGWGGLGSFGAVNKIVFHPTIPNMVFVGTSEGIYRSTDNLSTWTRLYPTAYITDIEFHPTDSSIVYLYDDDFSSNFSDNILRSTDLGVSYAPSALISGNNGQRGHIAVSPSSPNDVFFASTSGVWKSTDTGQNFNFLSNPNESCRGFAISDLSTQNMIYGYLDLEASTDGGFNFNLSASWFVSGGVMGPAYTHADLRTAECLNGVFYVGTDGYLAKTTDNGVTWTRLSDGTGIRENYRIGLSQSNWERQMLGSQDNGTSILNENGWLEWNGGDGMEAVIHPLNDDWMIGSWQFGSRNRTKDGGQTRNVLGNPAGGSGSADWIAPLIIDPLNHMRVYHFADSIFVSNDFGSTWTFLNDPGIGIIKLAVVANNDSKIMAVSRNDALKISTDGGQSFQFKTAGLPGYSITGLAFDPNDDQTLIITYNRYQNDGQKVFTSHNLGNTWTNITHNLGNMPLRTVVIDHTDEKNIFVGGEIGVYTKPMNGNTWSLYSHNLPNVTVRDLKVQNGSNVLRAATWGRGLWDIDLPNRSDHPAILHTTVTHTPNDAGPVSGQTQDVTSVISSANPPSSVFVKWAFNSINLNQIIPMQLLQDSTWQTEYPIPAHGGDSRIFFKVFAVGDQQDTTETYRFMYDVKGVSTCLPLSVGSNLTFISQTTFADINKSSGAQNYSDFRRTDSAFVNKMSLYNLDLKFNSVNGDTTFGAAYFDWNGDGDFDDLDEYYDMGFVFNQVQASSSMSPLPIRIPAHAVQGKIRMRVMSSGALPPASCAQGFTGETEDYNIIIQAMAPCSPTSQTLDILTTCDAFVVGPSGKIYSQNGTYTDTLLSNKGCDSLFTFDVAIVSVDTSITQIGSKLTSNEASGTYQWVDCSNGFSIISGETNRSFDPSQNGDYRVIVSNGSCTDTSQCINVTNVSVTGQNLGHSFSIYPNPSKGKFVLDLGEDGKAVMAEIYNSVGQKVWVRELGNGQRHSFNLRLEKGIYVVKVNSGEENVEMRLVIE